MSAFLNYRAQQTSYLVILCTTKIFLPPRFLKCTFPLSALTETCFKVNTLGEFAPERSVCSVGEGIEGGGRTCSPWNVMLAGPHWVHDCRCLVYAMSAWWLLCVSNVIVLFQVEIATQYAQRTSTGSLSPSSGLCERSNHWHEWHGSNIQTDRTENWLWCNDCKTSIKIDSGQVW